MFYSEWIDASKSLPKDHQEVLIVYLTKKHGPFSEASLITSARYNERQNKFDFLHGILNDRIITHWMPYPELPENAKSVEDILEMIRNKESEFPSGN